MKNHPFTALLRNNLASLMLVVLIAIALLSIYQQDPPAAGPSSIPATEFSSTRAMKYVEAIGRNPHPIGSREHAVVRDYLVGQLSSLGLSPEVQKTTSVNPARGVPFPAGNIENILSRIKGTNNSKPILLVAHYDSVPTGPGASDDGSSVAALLETLRALKAGPPLQNDVVVLFTDGEEPGLLGAKAFVEDHPWAKERGLVLNFEARGTSGASMMFETSPGNAGLIREFARVAPNPDTSSLFYEIYKVLPNDTDFTIFKNSGFDGLNFAYINDVSNYHTGLDNVGNVSERSLQHQGSYALALTRGFGNLSLNDLKQNDAIYFNTILTFVRYPGSLAKPVSLIVALGFLGVVIFGFKKKQVTFFGIVFGFIALLVNMIAGLVLGIAVWVLIRKINSGYQSLVQPYNAKFYIIAFVSLAVALTSSLYILFRIKISLLNLTIGGLVWWLILMLATAFLLPGASFLFTWPLFFSLLALTYGFKSNLDPGGSVNSVAVLCVSAMPAIILFAPLIYILFIALTINAVAIDMLVIILLLGALVPQFNLTNTRSKWLLPVTMALVALASFVAGSITSGFDQSHPKPDNLSYALNADSGSAVWVSSDPSTDQYTSQALAGNSEKSDGAQYLPLKPAVWNTKKFLTSAANTTQLPAPNIVLLDDKNQDGLRTLRMRITSPRQAPVISIALEPGIEILKATINGKIIEKLPARKPSEPAIGWGFNYYAPPDEGIELVLESKATGPFKIRVIDESYGLPEIPGKPSPARPPDTMASIFPYSNSTLVSKTFTY